jgi:hypothetical protein
MVGNILSNKFEHHKVVPWKFLLYIFFLIRSFLVSLSTSIHVSLSLFLFDLFFSLDNHSYSPHKLTNLEDLHKFWKENEKKKKAPSIHKWWSASTTTRRRIFGFNYDNTIINCPYINFCILFGHHYFCILFYSIKSSRFLTNLLRTLIPNYNKIFLRFSPFLVKNRLIGRRLLLTVNVIHAQNHTLV